MSIIICKYCGQMYDSDFHSWCPSENHQEDGDYPFYVNEQNEIVNKGNEPILAFDWGHNIAAKAINAHPILWHLCIELFQEIQDLHRQYNITNLNDPDRSITRNYKEEKIVEILNEHTYKI